MEELNLIIQDFEETCSTLAITHDSPCEEMIKEKFEEYHQAKLKLLDIANVINQRELLIDFAETYQNCHIDDTAENTVDWYLRVKDN